MEHPPQLAQALRLLPMDSNYSTWENNVGTAKSPIPLLFGGDLEASHICPGGGVASPADALLAQLPGTSAHPSNDDGYTNINDVGRRFMTANGICHYKDLDHLESCTPICRGADEFTKYVQATRADVQDALHRHNEASDENQQLEVMFDNRCGRGEGAVSIGTHLNIGIPGSTWQEICSGRYPAVTGFYASAIAGIQLVAGLGCVGSANGRPHVNYQISQRSDFINTLLHIDTMGHPFRGMVNIRHEPECGPIHPLNNPIARKHEISLDISMSETALYVSSGLLALVAASISAGRIAPHLILHQPVRSLWQWSHDPDLHSRMPLADGQEMTLPEYFASLVEFLSANAVSDTCVEDVVEAEDIVSEAGALASAFMKRDWDYTARRVDWVQKRSLLETLLEDNPDLDWHSDAIAMVDQHYSSADPETGLYYVQRRLGEMETRVNEDDLAHARIAPPTDTRAWGFAHMLRVLEASPSYRILSVNWDRITVWEWGNGTPITIWLPHPESATQKECGHLFSGAFSTQEIVRAMQKIGLDRLYAMETTTSGILLELPGEIPTDTSTEYADTQTDAGLEPYP